LCGWALVGPQWSLSDRAEKSSKPSFPLAGERVDERSKVGVSKLVAMQLIAWIISKVLTNRWLRKILFYFLIACWPLHLQVNSF